MIEVSEMVAKFELLKVTLTENPGIPGMSWQDLATMAESRRNST